MSHLLTFCSQNWKYVKWEGILEVQKSNHRKIQKLHSTGRVSASARVSVTGFIAYSEEDTAMMNRKLFHPRTVNIQSCDWNFGHCCICLLSCRWSGKRREPAPMAPLEEIVSVPIQGLWGFFSLRWWIMSRIWVTAMIIYHRQNHLESWIKFMPVAVIGTEGY